MANTLQQFFVQPTLSVRGAISLTLTNTIYYPGDPTSNLSISLTIDHGTTVAQPQIEVSLTHAEI